MKTYVIGDLHGGYRGLIQCLEKVNFDYDNDKLVSVGDLCDGWSETHLIIQELKKIKNCVYVMGNHDEWSLEGLQRANKLSQMLHNSSWLMQGGAATKDSYESLNETEKKEFIEFLEKAKPYYVDDKNRLFVHAGYNREISLEDPKYTPEWEINSGGLWWDRTMWENLNRGYYPEDPRFTKVFIGHTPTIINGSSKPINIGNVWNVDTGAAFFGPVTIMNIDTQEYWQSEYVFKLYPDEKGRNRVSFNNMLIKDWTETLLQYDIHL